MNTQYRMAVAGALTCVFLSACSTPLFPVSPERDFEIREQLRNVEDWFIEEGIGQYYDQGDEKWLLGEVQSRSHGYIGDYFYATREPDKGNRFVNLPFAKEHRVTQILCYARNSDSKLYEYWVIHRASKQEVVYGEAEFIVTEAESLESPRTIIHRSNRFFESYEKEGKTVIRFPIENDIAIRTLKPWYVPDHFEGTSLYGVTLVWQGDHYERVTDLGLWKEREERQKKSKRRALWLDKK